MENIKFQSMEIVGRDVNEGFEGSRQDRLGRFRDLFASRVVPLRLL